jgi:hypothetical protein
VGERCRGGREDSRGGARARAIWKRGIDVDERCQEANSDDKVAERGNWEEEEGRATPSRAVLIERKSGIKNEGAVWMEKSMRPRSPMDMGRCAIIQGGELGVKAEWLAG